MGSCGRVALVTGAASGIGRVAARRLAEAGARVAAVDQSEEGLRETARGHPGIRCHPIDVSDARGNPRDLEQALAHALRVSGGVGLRAVDDHVDRVGRRPRSPFRSAPRRGARPGTRLPPAPALCAVRHPSRVSPPAP
jgi:NAD(P)-dependent dehydrogenase (short-subunit alcohol dehydrogenase family)